MLEIGKKYNYEITNRRVAYPLAGICVVTNVEKAKVNGLFRKGEIVVYFEAIKDGKNLPSIRMSFNDVEFCELTETV